MTGLNKFRNGTEANYPTVYIAGSTGHAILTSTQADKMVIKGGNDQTAISGSSDMPKVTINLDSNVTSDVLDLSKIDIYDGSSSGSLSQNSILQTTSEKILQLKMEVILIII